MHSNRIKATVPPDKVRALCALTIYHDPSLEPFVMAYATEILPLAEGVRERTKYVFLLQFLGKTTLS
jgi:hypothetical protein